VVFAIAFHEKLVTLDIGSKRPGVVVIRKESQLASDTIRLGYRHFLATRI
jgi:hypothetical protein